MLQQLWPPAPLSSCLLGEMQVLRILDDIDLGRSKIFLLLSLEVSDSQSFLIRVKLRSDENLKTQLVKAQYPGKKGTVQIPGCGLQLCKVKDV